MRRRTARLIALGVCAAVVLAGAALVAERRAIARSLIARQLRALGLEEVEHVVERFGFAEFGVRDFRVGSEDDLVVERIDARYSPASLLAGRLEDLSIQGVRLRGTIDAGGVSFGALDPLLERGGGGGGKPAPVAALPASNIAIEDVAVELETPRGPLAVPFEAHVRETQTGDVEAEATLGLHHALLDGAARVELAGTLEAFEGNAALELEAGGAIGAGAELEPAALALEAAFAFAEKRLGIEIRPAPFAIAVQRGDVTSRLEGETPALTLVLPPPTAGAARAIRLTSAGGRVRLADYDLEARDITVDVTLDAETGLPSGSLRAATLVDTQNPARLPELSLAGTFEVVADEVEFDLTAASRGDELVITARGVHDVAAGRGEARVRMKPLDFTADGLQPATLSPLLGESVEAASGSIEARGAVAWEGEAVRSDLDVALRDLSVSSVEGGVEHLNAAIRVSGPWPPSTPAGQLVSMARVDFGLELTNGLITFQLGPDGVLDLASAEWSLAGGTIRTSGKTDLGAETQELVLELADIDLSQLLALADIDGLTGSGTLHGRVPVVRRGATLEIRNGKLSAAEAGGWIRYRADAGFAGVASQGQGFNVVLAALENFHYDGLEATLDGDTSGPVNVSIHLAGANPDYLAGHPIEFNLNIESRLVDLLQKATAVYRIPAEIERKLQEMSEESP
jgi:hypothetical protein